MLNIMIKTVMITIIVVMISLVIEAACRDDLKTLLLSGLVNATQCMVIALVIAEYNEFTNIIIGDDGVMGIGP